MATVGASDRSPNAGLSRLSASLKRLQRPAAAAPSPVTAVPAVSVPERLLRWQEQWSDRREQIAQRLALIDEQLDAVARQKTTQATPPRVPGGLLESLVPEI